MRYDGGGKTTMQPADTLLSRTDEGMNRPPRVVSWISRVQLPLHRLRRQLGGVVARCWFQPSHLKMPYTGCLLGSVKNVSLSG